MQAQPEAHQVARKYDCNVEEEMMQTGKPAKARRSVLRQEWKCGWIWAGLGWVGLK